METGAIIIVRRRIASYQNVWALPGLRQYKRERFRETLERIARDELGLEINPEEAEILGQYDGFFPTRQDMSTGYHVRVPPTQEIRLNRDHFFSHRFINAEEEIPRNMGAMYKYFLRLFFQKESKNSL